MGIVVVKVNGSLEVTSPYNSMYIAAAKKLGGRWTGSSWVFDARDEERVKALLVEFYGFDGFVSDTVTLRVEWVAEANAPTVPITVHGRTVAKATGRDSGARLGDGVVVLQGGFSSGGSVKNWTTTCSVGTVVLLRDFPRLTAEDLVARQPHPKRKYYIEEEAPVFDRAKLIAERDALLTRLAAIDALLA